MIPLFLILLCATGALLAARLDPAAKRFVDVAATGAALALALFAACGFVLGAALGMSSLVVLAAAFSTLAITVGFGESPAKLRERFRGRPSRLGGTLAVVTVLAVTAVANRAVLEGPQGISIGDKHNLGDLPFHMAIAAGFAWGGNFPPQHPELTGVPLTYPFFCDLLSGMILTLGGSWREAFFYPTWILGLSVVVVLTRFGESVSGSRGLGRASAVLTLLSGGLGFLRLSSGDAVSAWWSDGTGPDLTADGEGLRYANFVMTLFIPQRAILFGWPLLFTALALVVESLRNDASDGEVRRRSLWMRAGLIGSLLPLVHSHSFAVLGFCVLLFLPLGGLRSGLAFAAGVLPAAAPAVLFMALHNSVAAGRFFEWQPGFDGGSDAPFVFWMRNAGPFLILVMLGLLGRWRTPRTTLLAVPFATLFLAANLFRLSPWIWDNMKFLAPAHAGLAPFAALALGALWSVRTFGPPAASALLVVATLSGGLDVLKIGAARVDVAVFSKADLEYAAHVRENTPRHSTILTAPTHNHPVLLSGRRLFFGYEGHLWSQGLTYTQRKADAEAVLRGDLERLRNAMPPVDAMAWTPAETGAMPNRAGFEALPSWVESPYRLLKIR